MTMHYLRFMSSTSCNNLRNYATSSEMEKKIKIFRKSLHGVESATLCTSFREYRSRIAEIDNYSDEFTYGKCNVCISIRVLQKIICLYLSVSDSMLIASSTLFTIVISPSRIFYYCEKISFTN